jgi:hypothetical protein
MFFTSNLQAQIKAFSALFFCCHITHAAGKGDRFKMLGFKAKGFIGFGICQ